MTDDEFRDKFKLLMEEYDPNKKKDYLLTIVSFEVDDDQIPDEIFMLGRGCPACIATSLMQQVDDGELLHHDSMKNHKSIH